MKIQSLKSYLAENADFFCWDNPHFDMSFTLNTDLYYTVYQGEYSYNIYTPNLLFADIKLEENVFSFEDIRDEAIKTDLLNKASLVYDQFPVEAIPEYKKFPVNFFKKLRFGFNIIQVKRLTNEEIKNQVTIERNGDNGNIWRRSLLTSIVPADLYYPYTHRMMFELSHADHGFIDFYLDSIEI